MILNNRQRGIFFLSLSILFSLVFLIGGGVVRSTNGGALTASFLVGVVLGMVSLGPFVYRSARVTRPTSTARPTVATRLIGPLVIGISLPASQLFFRSELFKSPSVQLGFSFAMGVCLAQLVPLGLGFLAADSEALSPPDAGLEPQSSG